MYDLWRQKGLPITLEPQDVFWARIFYGLDPDGYERSCSSRPTRVCDPPLPRDSPSGPGRSPGRRSVYGRPIQ